ncbi:MAG: hypothetical protein GC158_08470 [Cyanobacteria bacterium RI_101]|nr:hypothetical protein [Cyanobacteria bacterium RI_101]
MSIHPLALLPLTLAPLALTPAPTLAIAPGFNQLKLCREYTADKFRVTLEQVSMQSPQKVGSSFKIAWTIPDFRGRGYCLVSKDNKMLRYQVEREPDYEAGNNQLGPNERRFENLPGYGDVIVNRGQGATGDRQYFLLKTESPNRTYRWYARCVRNSDQVYDHRGRYVGYDPRLTVMFPYVCEVSPLKPGGKPQPR